MPNKPLSEDDLLRSALGPSQECPPIEELELVLTKNASAAPLQLKQHLKSCAYCQTELQMLSAFEAGGTAEDSEEAKGVAAQLRSRSKQILQGLRSPKAEATWWDRMFGNRWLAPASLAAALVLLVAGGVIKYEQGRPQPILDGTNPLGQEVLRSSSLTVIRPSGDLRERPSEIRWQPIQGATNYQVRLLEVDRSEVWNTQTSGDHVELPPAVVARIVPAKTLFCEITAFDSSGSKVGGTGLVRFRLLQKAASR